jgi:hypothetical protein
MGGNRRTKKITHWDISVCNLMRSSHKILVGRTEGKRPHWRPVSELHKSHDSSVGIVLCYRLDDRCSRVRFPAGTGNFSPNHRFRNGSGAHPTSYPMGNRSYFSGTKAAGA